MAELKINVKYGIFELNLEGESSVVNQTFKEIKEEFISKLITGNKKDSVIEEDHNIDKSEEIIIENSQKNKKQNKTKRIEKRPTMIGLSLDHEKINKITEDFNKYEINSIEKAIPLVFYLYNTVVNDDKTKFDIDLTFTLLKTVEFKKIPANFSSTLSNVKNRGAYIVKNEDSTYSTSHTIHNFMSKLKEKVYDGNK